MQIDTDSLLISTLIPTIGSTGTASTEASSTSLFGPSTLLSLGADTTTASGYSHLAPGFPSSTSDIPQYDLAAVLQAGVSVSPAAQRSSKQIEAENAAVKKALGHMDLGQYDEARAVLDDMLSDDPTSAVAVHALGALELKLQDYEKAERLFIRADFLDPEKEYSSDVNNARFLQKDDASVLAQALRLVAFKSTREDGIRLLVNLTDRSPRNTEARMLLAESLLDEGDAINGLQQFNRAIILADQGELGQIESRLKELVEIAPDAAYVRQLLGKAQLGLHKYEEAAATLAIATRLSGGSLTYKADEARALVGLGRELLNRRDITGAISKFEMAQDYARSNTEVKVALAEGYAARAQFKFRIGARDAAILDYRLAAQKLGDSGHEALRRRLALGAYTAGVIVSRDHQANGEDIDNEVVAFQTAYDIDPDNTTYKQKLAETRNALGDQYMADSDYSAAASAYDRAHRLYENNATYKSNAVNAYVLKGDELLTQRKYDEAIAAYKRAFDIDSDDATSKQKLADGYNARGLHYKEDGKYTLAASDFKEALNLFPNNSTYQANYDSVKYY